jgi:hypothetical protein
MLRADFRLFHADRHDKPMKSRRPMGSHRSRRGWLSLRLIHGATLASECRVGAHAAVDDQADACHVIRCVGLPLPGALSASDADGGRPGHQDLLKVWILVNPV